MDNSMPQAFIFMKVGDYGGECLEDILERKQRERELDEKKRIFWGYGSRLHSNHYGGPLHPIEQVQPFAKEWDKELGSIEVLMQRTNSNPKIRSAPISEAKEYSADRRKWKPLPSGTKVTYNNLALVLDEIRECHFHLDLEEFKVGARNSDSYGKSAAEYLKDQTDKGCLVEAESKYPGPAVEACITYRAYLKHPYAVFLR